MGYNYGANFGLVVPFNEDTAKKMGILPEFLILQNSEDGFDYLQEFHTNDPNTEMHGDGNIFDAAVTISNAIEETFGKNVELNRVSGDFIQSGDIVTDENMLFFFFGYEDLFFMNPKPLLLRLKEKGLEPVADAWVTGG